MPRGDRPEVRGPRVQPGPAVVQPALPVQRPGIIQARRQHVLLRAGAVDIAFGTRGCAAQLPRSISGPSGSGKSSVVLARVVPALQAREPDLGLAYLTPGSEPAATLPRVLDALEDRRAVVVVDQFEELFTLCGDDAARRSFVDRLLAAADDRLVVLSMRADFWGDCSPFPAPRERMLTHQELIPPMTIEELRSRSGKRPSRLGCGSRRG